MPHRLKLLTLLLALLCALPAHAEEGTAAAEPDAQALWVAEHLPAGLDREAAAAMLRDAGDNWAELAAALEASPSGQERQADMLWLLNNAPHLDRLELRSEMLLSNHELALSYCGEGWGYQPGSEFFRRYILNYRIDDEPVTDWRSELNRRYGGPDEEGSDRAFDLVARVAQDFRIVERGYFGNLADPVAIDNARAGTERELALLCAAVLRSQGFATRFTRENMTGTSWVEVYDGDRLEYDPDAWIALFPQAPEQSGNTHHALELCGGSIAVVTAGDAFGREQVTARYTPVGLAVPRFSRDGHYLPDFEHWTITAWHEGSYVPLDDLGYPTSEADYPLTDGANAGNTEAQAYALGAPGDYRLQCGVRYPGGTVQVLNRDFSLLPGDRAEMEIEISTPLELPDEALRERGIAAEIPEEFAWLSKGVQLFFIHDEGEPSVRTALLVQEFDRRAEISFHSEKWQDRPEGWQQPEDYSPELLRDVLKVSDADEKPVLILLVDGELRLYLRGYNLNVADWIRRQLPAVADAG
ncbi:MAG: hypothetical protein R3F46_00115 [bacterium]